MKKILATTVIAAALAVPAVVGAASANADSSTDGFLYDVHSAGFQGGSGDRALVANGNAVCNLLAQGYSGTQIANYVYLNTPVDVSSYESGQFVRISVDNLCPEWHSAILASARRGY